MINAATKGSIGTAICGVLFICGVALAQQSSEGDSGPKAAAPVEEEIIVRGQRPAQLRLQIQRTEEAVYNRFNEINSNDEFDIHCRQEKETGTHLLRRVCQANFWRKAQADAGEEAVRSLRGSSAVDAQYFHAQALYKRQLLVKEMKRLATEDEEMQRELVRLGNLQQALDTAVRASSATSSTEQTAGEGQLPYDAAAAADVRIGRKPWQHTLTQRTFTFAHVYGEIRDVELKCGGQNERLHYETGAEWTVPDDWGACDLRVDAPSGTTFSLYEFQ